MGLSLSPDLLRRAILGPELELRRGEYGPRAETIIRRGLAIGSRIIVEDHIASGFARVAELIDQARESGQSFPDGLILFSRQLSSGRGRFHRAWHAPEGGIWLTLVIANTLTPAAARLVPFVIGVAVCETVREYAPGADLRWVNDVILGGLKVAGILVETLPSGDEEFILCGIGLNVNNRDFPPELSGLATSLAQATGSDIPLEEVARSLIGKLAWNIGLLHEVDESPEEHDEEDHPILARWRELSDTVGRRVAFGHDLDRQVMYEAVVESLAADGSLNLRLADGTLVNEVAGELRYLDLSSAKR